MMLTTPPDRPRKTLASQLDRLENILDRLPETLQGAVSAAVEKAVTQAVEQVLPTLLTALLTNPQLLNTLHSHAATAASSATPVRVAVRDGCRRLGQISRTAYHQVWVSSASWLGQAVQNSPRLVVAMKWLCRCKRRVLCACGVGLGMSLVIYSAGPWLSVLVGFLLGFLLTLAVQNRHRLSPLLTTLIDES